MNSSVLKRLVVCVSIAALLGAASALGSEESAAMLTLKAGKVTGKVTDALGEPLQGVTLKVTKGDEMITEAATDTDGGFALQFAAGTYLLAIDDTLSLPIKSSENGEISELVLVLPPQPPYSAASILETLGLDPLTWQGAGLGLLTLGGTAAALGGGGGGGSHNRVSP